jgi:hypothetical protein
MVINCNTTCAVPWCGALVSRPWRLIADGDGWMVNGLVPKLHHARCADRMIELRAENEKSAKTKKGKKQR